jgi:hypothetical protein
MAACCWTQLEDDLAVRVQDPLDTMRLRVVHADHVTRVQLTGNDSLHGHISSLDRRATGPADRNRQIPGAFESCPEQQCRRLQVPLLGLATGVRSVALVRDHDRTDRSDHRDAAGGRIRQRGAGRREE